ncbi:TraB/GumN family protein [Pseudomonadota bacterium]
MHIAQEVGCIETGSDVAHGEPQITLEHDGVAITILGTAHVSNNSVDTVRKMIASGDYDAVALELCENRQRALLDPDAITKLDLVQVIRKGRGPMVIASLAMGAFQQRIADQLGVEVGGEMRAAIEVAEQYDIPVTLIDRDIGTTLKRIYRNVPFWKRFKLLSALVASVIARRSVSEDEIERLKDGDVLESTFNQFSENSQEIYHPLVHERDQYMVAKLMQAAKGAGNKRVLVVVGAGHIKGMRQCFNKHSDEFVNEPEAKQRELEQVPPAGNLLKVIPWMIVGVILLGFVLGFAQSSELGWLMVQQWVLINGSLAAIGATIALAHPMTILSAFVAAPLTSLNPAISAGVVTAAVETLFRKPSVGDFSRLRTDTCRISGWWSNRVAHTLMVFFFSGVGSVIGTYVAGYKIFESIAVA